MQLQFSMATPSRNQRDGSKRAAEILLEQLRAKMDRNPRYSARALARDISVSPAFVSMLLNGKKKLSLERARQISRALGMTARQRKQFLRSVLLESVSSREGDLESLESVLTQTVEDDVKRIELDQFQFFSQWYHVAILDLTLCDDFDSDPEWIGARLGIPAAIARNATERLLRLGLLIRQDEVLKKSHAHLAVSPRLPDGAIRNFHRQMMERARQALEDGSPEAFARRDISGMTMAIDPTRMNEARALIKDFKRRMADLLTVGPATSVYQLNVQFFPLSTETSQKSQSNGGGEPNEA